MRATWIRLTGVERRFGADEIIVTRTDPRGVITHANDVFPHTYATIGAARAGTTVSRFVTTARQD